MKTEIQIQDGITNLGFIPKLRYLSSTLSTSASKCTRPGISEGITNLQRPGGLVT
jgi:hypothetical protein